MNKRILVAAFLFLIAAVAEGQYYYKDIVSSKQAAADKKILNEKKIRNILVHSFEGNGTASEGFFCEKKISKDFRQVETFTKAYTTGKSMQISKYNETGNLKSVYDSSDLSVNSTRYEYNAKGDVTNITSLTHSNDDDFTTIVTESHLYFYNEKGQAVKMLRTKNQHDSVQIDFIIDEKGNITDEIEPGAKGKHYYYYYDDKNRLTDIVKYHPVKKELRPDVVFEYDEEDHLIQMLSVDDGATSDYYTWKYIYNDGLRIIEKCFSKEKDLLGYFEYEYN